MEVVQTPSSWKASRRTVLAGGLLAGAALVGGGLFVGTHLRQSQRTVTTNRRPLLDMNWDGLDFAWLAGSSRIACVSAHGLFVVDVKSGKQVNFSASDTYTTPVTWSSDGTRLTCFAQNRLCVLDVQNGRNLWSNQHSQQTIQTASLSPDGAYLALARYRSSSNEASPTIDLQIWNVQAEKMLSQHTASSIISGMAWSPESGHIAITGQDGSVQLWNVAASRLIWSYQAKAGVAGVISWSPDGSLVAFAANSSQNRRVIGTWEALTGKMLFEAEADVGDPTVQDRHNPVAIWSPDSTRIAFWSKVRNDQAIQICSARSGQPLFTCERVGGLLSSLTWSPDGKYLAAGNYIVGKADDLAHGDNGDRSVVQFWDAQNGKALFSFSAPKSPDHLSWSPDSRLLAVITPKIYAPGANSACQSLCRYGYQNPALQVFPLAYQ